MNNKENLLFSYVENIFSNSTQVKYWEHTKRVFKYMENIAFEENASLEILRPAVLLHDIGMTVDASYQGHVKKSILLGKSILVDLKYDENLIGRILKVIESHNIGPGEDLTTIEEKILYDCDFLEVVGVFGALRWIGTFPVYVNDLVSSINLFLNIYTKCVDSRGSIFYTNTAKNIGDLALQTTVDYFRKVKKHIEQYENDFDKIKPIEF